MHEHEDIPMSRTGHTAPGGKLTAELTVRLSEDVADALTMLAMLNRKPKGEVAREIIEEALLGRITMLQRRVGDLAGLGSGGSGAERGR